MISVLSEMVDLMEKPAFGMRKTQFGLAWGHMPIISDLGRLRQQYHKFELA
jgi:hypothetical protein